MGDRKVNAPYLKTTNHPFVGISADADVETGAYSPEEFKKMIGKRRLAASSVISDHDAPSDWLLAPLLLILILVFFMYRKPIQEFLSGSNSQKTSYGGLRNIQKKSPVRHF